MRTVLMSKSMVWLFMLLVASAPVAHASDPEMFVVRATSKSEGAVVQSVEAFANKQNWFYMGADTIMGGRVTLVKICIPAVGKLILPQGMKYSAMLPCANLSVYQNGGKTEVSMLNAEYMYVLAPSNKMAETVRVAKPLLDQLIAAAVD